MKNLFFFGFALLFTLSFSLSAEQELTAEQEQYYQKISQQWNAMNKMTGTITLPNGVTQLEIPDDFFYLAPKDANTVLVDFWGNPPSEQLGDGLIMPSKYTPFDADSWAVTIDYTEEGYVSDEDAADINFQDLLAEMQQATEAANKERHQLGYPAMHLLGWAQQPYYDNSEKKLHWAKEFKVADYDDNTLNYDIRILGRRGYLEMSFIASMNSLPEINKEIDRVLNFAEFTDGNKYSQFDSNIDDVAAYGIGALVAGKLAAKTGILAMLLVVFKKFGIFILVGVAALFKGLFNFFRKPTQQN